jgi:hypothetical protein
MQRAETYRNKFNHLNVTERKSLRPPVRAFSNWFRLASSPKRTKFRQSRACGKKIAVLPGVVFLSAR